MDTIHFEKQEARLCAQHALNMLLQGPYFTASDLSEIGLELDSAEQVAGVEHGGESHNVDDTGFFSVQVIAEALRRAMNLTMTPILHPEAATFRANPTSGRGYICNLDQHWFAVRRFGNCWFELNSIKNGPVQISESHLNEFFAQLNQEGYSVFIVDGNYPSSRAEAHFSEAAEVGSLLRRPINLAPVDEHVATPESMETDDPELRAVLEMSRQAFDGEDVSLARALEASRLSAAAQNETEDAALQEALRASKDLYDQQLKEALLASMKQADDEEELKRAMEISVAEANKKFEMETENLIASTCAAGPSGFSYPRGEAGHSPKASPAIVASSSGGSSVVSQAAAVPLMNGEPKQMTQEEIRAEQVRRQRAAFLDRLQAQKDEAAAGEAQQ
ncbi:hypothetical protein L596_012908 [Steinernema carpocapsae]|uniref:ubiquitinyl hydrolase 1 n=1 Tax=Steinernema carpocapsae TaxID=34508 RepID=A0A4V6A4X9_STECR|nr:hypothetical protein L596_012908 [Steinernema carpocapsae]